MLTGEQAVDRAREVRTGNQQKFRHFTYSLEISPRGEEIKEATVKSEVDTGP